MSEPRTLPSRRPTKTIDFEMSDGYACQDYSACYAEFTDGTLAEVFLAPVGGPNGKVGLPLDMMAKDMSVLFSIAVRYGAPVEIIRGALSQENGRDGRDGAMLGPLGAFLRLHAAEMPILPPAPQPDTPLGSASLARPVSEEAGEDGGVRADPHVAVATPRAGDVRIIRQEPRVSLCEAAFKRALRWLGGLDLLRNGRSRFQTDAVFRQSWLRQTRSAHAQAAPAAHLTMDGMADPRAPAFPGQGRASGSPPPAVARSASLDAEKPGRRLAAKPSRAGTALPGAAPCGVVRS